MTTKKQGRATAKGQQQDNGNSKRQTAAGNGNGNRTTKANTGDLRPRAARFAQDDGGNEQRQLQAQRQVQQQVPPLRS